MSLRTPPSPPLAERERPAGEGRASRPAGPARWRGRARRWLRPAAWPERLALAAIVAGGLALRLYGNDHGLPFVYHPDEAFHYTSRAIGLFGGDPNPHYFQNPSGFTYLVYLTLSAVFPGARPFQDHHGFLAAYAADPSSAFHTARCVAAALSMLGVVAVYAVGRRLWGAAEGIAAAGVLSFGFLPVAYSRFALPDVGVLLPVAVAVYGIVRVREDGARRWFVVAGAATGFAVGFKYTAGVLVVPLLVAAFPYARRDRAGRIDTALALGAATVAFLVTTPFFLLDLHNALYQLKVEQRAAAAAKLGQTSESPFVFYGESLGWALGVAPALAAAAGLVLELRRDRPRAVLLLLLPALLWIYLSLGAGRYFARWLLPAYPVLALFAGVALAWLARRLSRRPAIAAAALVLLVAGAVVQPLLADVHTGRVLGKEDTRQLARDFLFRTLPAGTRLVADPALPDNYFRGHFELGFGPPPKTDALQPGSPARFIRRLSPARIDQYRRARYCFVLVFSLVRDRVLLQHVRSAIAYYRALPREGRVVFHASPYRPGAKPVPFDFDFSTHLYYPSAYQRPGPEVWIYRLNRCQAGSGPA